MALVVLSLVMFSNVSAADLPRIGSKFGQDDRAYFGFYFKQTTIDSCVVDSFNRTLVSYADSGKVRDTLALTGEQWSVLQSYLVGYELYADSLHRGMWPKQRFDTLKKVARHQDIVTREDLSAVRIETADSVYRGTVLAFDSVSVLLSTTEDEHEWAGAIASRNYDWIRYSEILSVSRLKDGEIWGIVPVTNDVPAIELLAGMVDDVAYIWFTPPEISEYRGQLLDFNVLPTARPVRSVGRRTTDRLSLNVGNLTAIQNPTPEVLFTEYNTGGNTLESADYIESTELIETRRVSITVEGYRYWTEVIDIGVGLSVQLPLTTSLPENSPYAGMYNFSTYSAYATASLFLLTADIFNYNRFDVSIRPRLGFSIVDLVAVGRSRIQEGPSFSQRDLLLQLMLGSAIHAGMWVSSDLMVGVYADIAGSIGGGVESQIASYSEPGSHVFFSYDLKSNFLLTYSIGVNFMVSL